MRRSRIATVFLLGLGATAGACGLTADLDALSSGPSSGGAGGGGGGAGGPAGGDGGAPIDQCETAKQCPPPGGKCDVPFCLGGECGNQAVARGIEVVGEQNPGDCKKVVCDGDSGQTEIADEDDPPDDLNPCTEDKCTGETPSNDPGANGAPCGQMLSCQDGQCVGCAEASECPPGNECAVATCESTVCGIDFAPNGTPLSSQVSGDCQVVVCNGMGLSTSRDDDTDLPEDDPNPCTLAACVAGSPAQVPGPAGVPCDYQGGIVCNAFGTCASCVADGVKNFGETDKDCGGPLCAKPCGVGQGCARGSDCTTGFCADGVCCTTECAEPCRACSAALNKPGVNGECAPVHDGTNDDGACDFQCVDGKCVAPNVEPP